MIKKDKLQCPKCKGYGYIVTTKKINRYIPCDYCREIGSIINEKKRKS